MQPGQARIAVSEKAEHMLQFGMDATLEHIGAEGAGLPVEGQEPIGPRVERPHLLRTSRGFDAPEER